MLITLVGPQRGAPSIPTALIDCAPKLTTASPAMVTPAVLSVSCEVSRTRALGVIVGAKVLRAAPPGESEDAPKPLRNAAAVPIPAMARALPALTRTVRRLGRRRAPGGDCGPAA